LLESIVYTVQMVRADARVALFSVYKLISYKDKGKGRYTKFTRGVETDHVQMFVVSAGVK
jgi:hypothetical protein